jgi:hypothetical protein
LDAWLEISSQSVNLKKVSSEGIMSFFTLLVKKLTEFKYRYYGLFIIQQVPDDRFHSIILQYKERGWELSGEYNRIEDATPQWSCKLRKGTSTLVCEWDEKIEGSFIGPERIVCGLGQEFCLIANNAPL